MPQWAWPGMAPPQNQAAGTRVLSSLGLRGRGADIYSFFFLFFFFFFNLFLTDECNSGGAGARAVVEMS